MKYRSILLTISILAIFLSSLAVHPRIAQAEGLNWRRIFPSLSETLSRILNQIKGKQQQALLTGAGSGLVASWSFDEGSGTSASDGSGNGYTGTLANGVLWTASGKTNGAISLDGLDDRVSNRAVPNLSAVSISLWVKVPSTAVTKRVFDRNGTNPIVRILSGGRVQFIGSVSLNSVGTLTTDTWNHIVVTGDATGHKVYINGILSNSSLAPYAITQTEPITIGGSFDSAQGDIDEVRIYDRALDASEVGELYADSASASPSPSPSPVVNQAPTVSVGSNQTITLPALAWLSGTASDDGLPTGSSLTLAWSTVSGPGTVSFSNATSASTSASFSVAGSYILRLTGSDGSLSNSATLAVTVNAATTSPTATTTPPVSASGTYYVDFDSGSDTNDGRSTLTAWKHAPGDTNATGNAKSTVLVAGNTVLFKGGVVYRGNIVIPASGTASTPITYKGDGWGTSKAIIDGSTSITSAWTRCASAADCGGNPNYANIYYTQAPAGYTSFDKGLYQDGAFLWYAQDPNPVEPFYYDSKDLNTYRIIPLGSATLKITRTSITDSRYFTQLDPNYWNDAYVIVWREGNYMSVSKVRSYTPLANTITFDDLGANIYTTFDTHYAVLNHLSVLDRPGEYVYSDTGRIYLWPSDSGTPASHTISYPVLDAGIYSTKSNVVIEGLVVRAFKNGIYLDNSPSNVIVRNNDVKYLKSNDWYAIRLQGTDLLAEGNTVTDSQRSVGILAGGSNIIVRNNYVSRTSRQGIWFMGVNYGQIVGNTVDDIRGTHSNAVSAYLSNKDILIANNKISRAQNAFTVHGDDANPTLVNNVTLYNNLVDGPADSWGHHLNTLTLVNNTFPSGFNVYSTDINVSLINNIFNGGGGRTGDTRWNNIYSTLSWWQGSQYGWTTVNGERIEANASLLYSNLAGKDYHLSATSPAVNTGINPLSFLPTALFPSFNFSRDLDGYARPQGTAWDIGAYEYGGSLVIKDDPATTTPPVNQAPTVSAGNDQIIILPGTAQLNGTVVDDGLPSDSLSVSWTKVSGPGTVSFSSASTTASTASFSSDGTYVLRLTGSDGTLSGSATVTITVEPAPAPAPINQAPTVSAGANQTITLPATATLSGTAADDGLPSNTLSLLWSKVSGPGTVSFTSSGSDVTDASFSSAGTYVLRLTGSDGTLSASATVTVTVNAEPVAPAPAPVNQAPEVSVGANQTITLPSTVILSATATDDDLPSNTLSLLWSKVSGPGTVSFTAGSSARSSASFSTAGTYVLRFTANDSALSASADLTVTVNAAPLPAVPNKAPIVSVGSSQAITLPDRVQVDGSVSDDNLPTGEISTLWSKVSGPGLVVFDDANISDTIASFSEAGDYILRLIASDGDLSSSADLVVVVNAAEQAPITRVVANTVTTSSGGGGGGGGGGTSAVRKLTTLPSPLTTLTSASSGAAPSITKVLVPGASGQDVVTLKNFLISQGYLARSATTVVTPVYDLATQRAVEAFQKKYRIVTAGAPRTTGFGAVGPKTRVTINNLIAVLTAKKGTIPARTTVGIPTANTQAYSLISRLLQLIRNKK